MEIRNINDCFKFRLLRKIKPDLDKANRSFELAIERLNEAKNIIDFKIFHHVILDSYMAMFHASRALLYQDGIQEKSHFAIEIYLKEKYKDKIPFHILNLLQIHRIGRHDALYSLSSQPDEEDALISIKDAESFIKEIKKLLS